MTAVCSFDTLAGENRDHIILRARACQDGLRGYCGDGGQTKYTVLRMVSWQTRERSGCREACMFDKIVRGKGYRLDRRRASRSSASGPEGSARQYRGPTNMVSSRRGRGGGLHAENEFRGEERYGYVARHGGDRNCHTDR